MKHIIILYTISASIFLVIEHAKTHDTELQTRKVTIRKPETSQYMQVNKGHVMFDELKSQKPSQGVKDSHQSHFVEEMKLENIHGRVVLLRKYRYEGTNTYLRNKDDGSIGLDENPTTFIITPSKEKKFVILEDIETSRCLFADHNECKFEVVNTIDSVEEVPSRFKIIIEKSGCEVNEGL